MWNENSQKCLQSAKTSGKRCECGRNLNCVFCSSHFRTVCAISDGRWWRQWTTEVAERRGYNSDWCGASCEQFEKNTTNTCRVCFEQFGTNTSNTFNCSANRRMLVKNDDGGRGLFGIECFLQTTVNNEENSCSGLPTPDEASTKGRMVYVNTLSSV